MHVLLLLFLSASYSFINIINVDLPLAPRTASKASWSRPRTKKTLTSE